MSSKTAIRVSNLSKCYHIYDHPRDRLKQAIMPKFYRVTSPFFRREACYPHYFREFWALQGVSFEIGKGETVGIIGRNGSGKSTLLQMVAGILSPTAGAIETHGRIAALLELGAGFNVEFTGRENVLLNAAILGFPREEMIARMEKVVEFSELGDFLDQPVKTYSSGMYARLAFSIAIHVDPDIMIVDETLAVGDARFVAKCMRRIKDIQERGATILFVSHDVGSVRTLCERAIWLDKGRLVDQGDVFPVTGRYMEFMFDDRESPDDPVHGEIKPGGIPPDEGDGAGSLPAAALNPHAAAPADLDARPVTHWGSHKGLILAAGVCDAQGVRREVLNWGDEIHVRIEVNVPKDISREHLSVAFSIKDLKGTDLIVSTTRDFGDSPLPDEERFTVSFALVNPLVTGRYLLVAAVENRHYREIHYYEYVEGAHYFSSLSTERFFGLFQPLIQQHVLTGSWKTQ